MDVPLEISVELGRVKMMVRDVLELGSGAIIEIDKAAGEPVDVMVNGTLVARGEVVVIEDNFGVRITEIVSVERPTRLGEVA
jgi:flagellar motor switch protein FliN/FliY